MIVIFNTINASFKFNQKAVKKIIIKNMSKYLEEAESLAYQISLSKNSKIIIPEEPNYFGHIALDLIASGEGNAFCKRCIKTYEATQLKRTVIGCGGKPNFITRENKKSLKLLFKKMKPPTLFGGNGYKCPERHTLISIITWRIF